MIPAVIVSTFHTKISASANRVIQRCVRVRQSKNQDDAKQKSLRKLSVSCATVSKTSCACGMQPLGLSQTISRFITRVGSSTTHVVYIEGNTTTDSQSSGAVHDVNAE